MTDQWTSSGTYVDGFVAAVPTANKEAYRAHSQAVGAISREHGALAVVECWGEDVPEGKLNSFHTAVLRKEGETVVFSWMIWPDKAARDAGWQKIMADPRMQSGQNPMPFDGARMIYGGFELLVSA